MLSSYSYHMYETKNLKVTKFEKTLNNLLPDARDRTNCRPRKHHGSLPFSHGLGQNPVQPVFGLFKGGLACIWIATWVDKVCTCFNGKPGPTTKMAGNESDVTGS